MQDRANTEPGDADDNDADADEGRVINASQSSDGAALPLTGERTVPGVPVENY